MNERDAAQYLWNILTFDDVYELQSLWMEIPDDGTVYSYFLTDICDDVEVLEDFLMDYPDLFFVENGCVARYDSSWVTGKENAKHHFEEILRSYDIAPNYMNFRGHIGQAEPDAIDFINSFYPNESFKSFLQSFPDIFIVFADDTVSLIEDLTVEYFEDILNNFGDGQYFMNLRGYIGQAPGHIIEFINSYYPGDEFLNFLEKNGEVFEIADGIVYLP